MLLDHIIRIVSACKFQNDFAKCQTSSVVLGDITRASSYETTSGASGGNATAYTGGQVTNAQHADLRKSSISFGKSGGGFETETTVQHSFGSRTADEVKNAHHVNTASATQIRAEIDNGKQKHIMVSASHAAVRDVGAPYTVKLEKREGRHAHVSLGTEKHHLASETGATFKKHSAAVYTAPVQQQEVT